MITDWIPELDDDDLNTLVDALEAWESKDQAADMFGDIMDTVLGAKDPQAKMALSDQRLINRLQKTREKAVRKERSILLRAKLLTLRNRRRLEQTLRGVSVTAGAERGGDL